MNVYSPQPSKASEPSLRGSGVEFPHTLDEVRAEKARRSLREYVLQAWHVIEPATPYVGGWHVEAICEHLEAISRGEIRNLLINVPPRHMKSIAVSVMWPTWEWIANPHLRYIYSAYGEQLSIRDALKSRRLIQSPWYQRHFGGSFTLTGDQNQKSRYENDKTGYRVSTGVGGMATGEGGDRLVMDDPHKLADAHSDTALESAVTFWNETMSTRGNDPKTVAKVVIMQRLHEADLSGDIQRKMKDSGEQYETLVLPAEYERSAQLYVSCLGWKDPREDEGELLWPERFDGDSLKALKVSLGDSASGQLQQRPAPAGGAIFKREWWTKPETRYEPGEKSHERSIRRRIQIWDTGFQDNESASYSACVTLDILSDFRVAVRDVWRKKMEFPELEAAIVSKATEFRSEGLLTHVILENRASAQSALQTLKRSAPPWLRGMLFGFAPKGSKDEKCRQAAHYCAPGLVLLPKVGTAEWLFTFTEEELFMVPAASTRDMTDAFALGIIRLEQYLAQAYEAKVQAA